MQKGYVVKTHLEEFKGFFVVTREDFESAEGTVPVVVIEAEKVEEIKEILRNLRFAKEPVEKEDLFIKAMNHFPERR